MVNMEEEVDTCNSVPLHSLPLRDRPTRVFNKLGKKLILFFYKIKNSY